MAKSTYPAAATAADPPLSASAELSGAKANGDVPSGAVTASDGACGVVGAIGVVGVVGVVGAAPGGMVTTGGTVIDGVGYGPGYGAGGQYCG
jgi:hypothetical protein